MYINDIEVPALIPDKTILKKYMTAVDQLLLHLSDKYRFDICAEHRGD